MKRGLEQNLEREARSEAFVDSFQVLSFRLSVLRLVFFGFIFALQSHGVEAQKPSSIKGRLQLIGKSEQTFLYEETLSEMMVRIRENSSVENQKTLQAIAERCQDRDLEDLILSQETFESRRSVLVLTCRSNQTTEGLRETTFLIESSSDESKLQISTVEIELQGSQLQLSQKKGVAGEPNFLANQLRAVVSVSLARGLAREAFPGEDDKVLHSSLSALLATGGSIVARDVFQLKPEDAVKAGAGFSFLLGLAREVWQLHAKQNKFAQSRDDMKANALGILLGSFVARISF